MALLPTEGLQLPIDWDGQVLKKEFQSDSYDLEIVDGFRPWRETTTISYLTTPAKAYAFLQQLKAERFSEAYDYQCRNQGWIKVRPASRYSIRENHSGMFCLFTLAVKRVG